MSNAEIVVVGAGVAGLSAALAVADAGQDVTLVTKADLVESNTYHAQGGIAAAVFADDDPKLHAADTMAAGHGLCEPRAVEILTREGADRVRQFAARACISIVTRKATCCVASKPRIRGPVSCTPGETPPARWSNWMCPPWCGPIRSSTSSSMRSLRI